MWLMGCNQFLTVNSSTDAWWYLNTLDDSFHDFIEQFTDAVESWFKGCVRLVFAIQIVLLIKRANFKQLQWLTKLLFTDHYYITVVFESVVVDSVLVDSVVAIY